MNYRAEILAFIFAVVVFMPVSFISLQPVSAQAELDLIVEDSSTVHINTDYVLTGNILIKDNGVLIISYSNFQIYQAHDYQYSVTVEGNGHLILLYSSLSSNAKLNIVLRGNSSLFVESGIISCSGNLILLSMNSNSSILNSTLNTINATFGGAGLRIKNTTITNGLTIFDATEAVVEKSSLAVAIVSSGLLKMYDTTVSNFTVTNEGKAEIYRTLSVRVRDRIGQELAQVNLDVYRNIEGNTTTLVAHGKTDEYGSCNISLLTETYDASLYEGSHFFGNYIVKASFGSLNASAPFTFKPYGLSSAERNEVTIAFNEIVAGDNLVSPSSADLHLLGSQRMTIENNSEIGFKLDGNLFLENNAMLQIINSTVLLSSKVILLKENATLSIQNSILNSTATLYVQDKASLLLINSSVSVNAIVGLKGNFTLKGSTVRGNFYIRSSELRVENSQLLGGCIEVHSTENVTISFENAALNAASTFILAKIEKFNFANVSAQRIEFNSTEPLKVYNLTFSTIYTNTEVETYHFLEVQAINGNNRSVPNATVKVGRYEGSTVKEVTNGTTGPDGKITFALLSGKITGSSALFVGNYRITVLHKELSVNLSVALTASKSVVARFMEPIVPPLEIQILPNLPPKGYINETITVSGTVLYNHGPEVVVNGSIQITIVETGETWNTTTDSNGKFAIQINLPLKEGNYTIKIACTEKEYGFFNETTVFIEVELYTKLQSIWEHTPVVYGVSTLVITIILGIILIVVRYINRKRTYSLYPKNESALVRWAVETKHRNNER